jgi:AraC-like DNA-binding protein
MIQRKLSIATCNDVSAHNAGFFISRGRGAHPRRAIDTCELILVESGTLSIREEEHVYHVNPAEWVVLVSGREHEGVGQYSSNLRYYWIHFVLNESRCKNDAERTVDVKQHGTLSQPGRLTELFRWFLDEQERGGPPGTVADQIVRLMLLLLDDGGQGEPGIAELADQARRIIKVEYASGITTKDVAERLGCNPDYLGRVYRKSFGLSIIRSIHFRRTKEAKRRLLDSNLTINEISLELGYSDSGYFRRMFRRLEGISPREYRNLHGHCHVNTE